jgi:translocation and assembly module TamB
MPADPTSTAGRTRPQTPTSRAGNRWLKALALVIGGFVIALFTAVAGLWWWADTDGSLARALTWVAQSQPLTFERASGSLRAGGRVGQLTWQQDGLTVQVNGLTVVWQPWSLLQRKLELTQLAADSVAVNDARPAPAEPSKPPTALGLPLAVRIDRFAVGQLSLTQPFVFSATALVGRYEFDRLLHRLNVLNAQVATGRYSGSAALSSSSPLTLDARLLGALQTSVPGSNTPLSLNFQATASGPITELLAKAELQMTPQAAAEKSKPTQSSRQPQASATARIRPWATQPLAEVDAAFRDLNVAALWPELPQTQLTGSASVRPLSSSAGSKLLVEQAWQLQTNLTNKLPGPWDRQRLPLDALEANGEWRGGTALVRALKATLGTGELLANGEWADPATAATPGAEPAWKLQAALKNINPALLHSQLAALPLDGQATAQSQGAVISFNADLKAKPSVDSKTPKERAGKSNPLTELRLRDASTTGSWNAQQAGGMLALSAMRVRTDDAELSGQLDVQPKAQSGKGNLSLAAPGLDAQVKGDLRPTSGGGELTLRGRDAAQALRWLQKLPGVPASLQAASASGNAELKASWQGGWRDPALQAKLDVPLLDWQAATPAPAGDAQTLKIRAMQATLTGRLSQARLTAAGRIEMGTRRYALQLAAEGGRSASSWQGLINQLSVAVEDPALSAGAWRLATRGNIPLKWTPPPDGSDAKSGAFESGAGEAVLSAPAGRLQTATPSQALLTWQPVRWQAGELTTAGKLTGLPMAWIELLAGPQLAGAGLASNLLLDGEWDARLGNTLALKASLARSSGDLTVQTETAQGTSVRVAAGIRQARLSLASNGDDVNVALVWDSERAGTADGQLKTRLSRAAEAAGGGWMWAADAPLEGRLRAQLPRIGVWSVLAPPGWRLRGSLATDLRISAIRSAPQLSGDLLANDLALRSVVDGIEFGNGRLRARLDGTRMLIDEFTLQGAGDTGAGGTLTAKGDAGWIAGQPQVRLDARLERLRASLRTDRQLTVSGDLQASLAGKQAAIGGKLVVDQARILLPEEGTPQLSDDVVVRTARGVAAGHKAPAQTSEPAPGDSKPVAVKLAMQIDLGSDFRVQGKGIDTRLRGTLALAGESLRSPRLTGTINTDGGQYRAYGQRLDVEQGVIRFTGAIDNPTLDILAIRPNMPTQRVGVQILGTALLPRVRLYAQPELPDAEKLSWLIVGRASASGGAEAALLQQAALALLGGKGGGMSGGLAASLGLDELSFRSAASNDSGGTTEGAITLGKRFSSNFYAAYERSISGALGTLFVFYDLSQRFTVRAQAGQQSAVDLIYTVPYN